jgi:hypothetical protein
MMVGYCYDGGFDFRRRGDIDADRPAATFDLCAIVK